MKTTHSILSRGLPALGAVLGWGVFLLFGSAQAQTLIPLADTWEGYSVGQTPTNWTIVGSDQPDVTVELNNGTSPAPPAPAGGASPNEKSLFVSMNKTTDGGGLYNDFTSGSGGLTSGIYQASFQLYGTSLNGTLVARVQAAGSESTGYLLIKKDRVDYHSNGNSFSLISAGNFTTGKWYEFTMTIDMDNDLVSYTARNLTDSVDFNPVDNVQFSNTSTTNIERFYFAQFGATDPMEYYLNDVYFSQIPEPTVLGLVLAGALLATGRRRRRSA